MSTASAAADQTTGLLEKLSLDSQTKPQDATDATKKIPSNERSVTPLLGEFIDPTTGYISNGYQTFYYGGYNVSMNEWDEYTRFVNHDGVEINPGIYGDVYHHGYGYAPYSIYPSPRSPVPTLGNEGQLYGSQHYQYLGPFYQQSTPSSALCTRNQSPTSQEEISTSIVLSKPSVSVDATKANSNTIASGSANRNNASASLRTNQRNSSLASNHSYGRGVLSSGHSSGYQNPRVGYDAAGLPFTWYDGPFGAQHRPLTTSSLPSNAAHNNFTSMRNPNDCSSHFMGGFHTNRPTSGVGSVSPGFNRMCPNNQIHSQYGSTLRAAVNFGSNMWNSRNSSGQSGLMVGGKCKPTACYGNENLYGFAELNRGPRGHIKNPKAIVSATIASKCENLASKGEEDSSAVVPDKEQWNREDFPEEYSDAKFFIIKSYSEDDIHKSIKYSVWASTPHGNKKLDDAYQKSQKISGGCPVFLFFSVNASGQFVGLAEMVGPVDFDKTVDYWQQDKWTGSFPVKWHIVKDVPNLILRHITLENNDNKPVTNSRDTQEVKLEQGFQMVKIFKEHAITTSILDDFLFYDNRQKIMLEKKAKQRQLPKQVLEGKATSSNEKDIKDASKGKPLELIPTGENKESSSIVLKEHKPLDINGAANEMAGNAVKPEMASEVAGDALTPVNVVVNDR